MLGLKNLSPPDYARFLVMTYVNGRREKNGEKRHRFTDEEVKLVWFSKTLENWKALIITTFPDSAYYEVTHNGSKAETYVDYYEKVENVVYPDKD